MSATLNEDEFGDGPLERKFIVRGPAGWTDEFDIETIELLMRIGAIRQVSTTSALGWETIFYDTVGANEA